VWLDPADEAKCTDCGTCYQELPQFFEKTTVVIDGEARQVARMIPGAAQSVEVTPEIAARIERVRATCDSEIIR
jgi:pyruvate-ferredoxin/flavodoxin oxidoreductase